MMTRDFRKLQTTQPGCEMNLDGSKRDKQAIVPQIRRPIFALEPFVWTLCICIESGQTISQRKCSGKVMVGKAPRKVPLVQARLEAVHAKFGGMPRPSHPRLDDAGPMLPPLTWMSKSPPEISSQSIVPTGWRWSCRPRSPASNGGPRPDARGCLRVSTNSPAPKLKLTSHTPPPIAKVSNGDHRRKPAPIRTLTINHPSETLRLPITVDRRASREPDVEAATPSGPSTTAASVQPVPTPGPSHRCNRGSPVRPIVDVDAAAPRWRRRSARIRDDLSSSRPMPIRHSV
jgi:hypothetical protein